MKTAKALCLPLVVMASPLFAHSPIFQCSKSTDDTITCSAGYTDGTSAADKEIRIVDMQDQELSSGMVDDSGEYSFTPPAGEFHVVFDGGVNHQVTIYSGDID